MIFRVSRQIRGDESQVKAIRNGRKKDAHDEIGYPKAARFIASTDILKRSSLVLIRHFFHNFNARHTSILFI